MVKVIIVKPSRAVCPLELSRQMPVTAVKKIPIVCASYGHN